MKNSERKVIIYCEKCHKATYHVPKTDVVKSFMNGAFMNLTKGFSLMHQTQLYKCCECGNIVEVEEN